MRFNEVRSPEDVLELVERVGFLPFFKNRIPGFSLEECCPRELWFSDTVDGPWEWKGPVARTGRCVYGKLFSGKAGFVSREWFPDLANFRRDGYDFDARFEDGLAAIKDKTVFEAVEKSGTILSKDLKELTGRPKGFDTVITRLQMQTYVVISDFVYMRDKHGKTYGWGVAKYSTPEAIFGYDFVSSAYKSEPEGSRQRIVDHLRGVLPDVARSDIERLIK